SDLTLALDDITGSGDLTVETAGARPKLSGSLATSALDLTPFMGEPPADQPTGWGTEPLALDSLKSIDLDLTLTAPSLTIDKIVVSDAKLRARLADGNLTTVIDELSVFGGRWQGNLGVDAGQATPAITMALTGDSILMENLMQTLTGSDRVAGTGLFKLDISSRGGSVDAIMKALNGELSTNLADGAIKGVNLGQLFRTTTNLQQSLASGSLSIGLSPDDQTDFASFNTVLRIRNGVGQIQALDLINSVLSANGSGSINLGQQTLDMGLKFAADTAGQGNLSDIQLNGTAIPLRITGPWTSPSVLPDTGALAQALAGEQIDRLQNVVGDQIGDALGGGLGDAVGGELGSALGGILGGSSNADSEDGESEDGEEEDEEPTTEDIVENVAREALGGLFGRRD
ncbi:MAG: AsmA family protein, partial [Pseudomonadota bacterium]